MSDKENAAPQGASEPESIASVEDRLASFDFDAPSAPAGETEKPKEAGDEEALATLAGEPSAEKAAPEDDDPEVNLRDNSKVKLSELKRAYRPDWEKQTAEFQQRQEAFQRATQGFTQAQQQAALMLQNAVAIVQSKMPKAPDEALLETDPFEYQKQKAHYDKQQGELQQLRAAQAHQFRQAQQQRAQAYQQHLAQEKERAIRAIPDFKDPVKFARFTEEAKTLAQELGYSPSDLNGISDHRLMRLIHEAVEGRRVKAALAKAKDKLKAASERPPVEVQAPQKRRTPSQVQAEELRAQVNRLKKNPSNAKTAEDFLSRFP